MAGLALFILGGKKPAAVAPIQIAAQSADKKPPIAPAPPVVPAALEHKPVTVEKPMPPPPPPALTPAPAPAPAPKLTLAVTEEWINAVQAMPQEQQLPAVIEKLRGLNPGYDGQFKTGNHAHKNLPFLALFAPQVVNVTPLRALKPVALDLSNTSIADLSQLHGFPLLVLNVSGTLARDLTPLRDMPLEWLDGSKTNVQNLSGVESLPLLRLSLNDTQIGDLALLSNIKTLEQLHLGSSRLLDLAPLEGLKLKLLECISPVASFAPLAKMPLEELSAQIDPVRDAATLKAIATLKTINQKPAEQFWAEHPVPASAPAVVAVPPAPAVAIDVKPAAPLEIETPAHWAKAIKFNPFIDFKKDVVSGTWAQEVSYSKSYDGISRLQLPYHPPEEYDLHVIFVRAMGKTAFVLAQGGRQFQFDWGHGELDHHAFGRVIGAQPDANAPPAKPNPPIDNIQYNCVIQVRKGGAKTFLNGKFIAELKTDYKNVALSEAARLGDDLALGFVTDVTTTFPVLEVLELSGRGVFTRPNEFAAKDAERKRNGLPELPDDAWIKSVQAVYSQQEQFKMVRQRMVDHNPGSDLNTATFTLNGAGRVMSVVLVSAAFKDLSPVRAFMALQKLSVAGESARPAPFSDLNQLRGIKLTDLVLSCTSVSDLTPLVGMPLKVLSIAHNEVKDLTPLTRIPTLKELTCDFEPQRDGAILFPLRNLEKINAEPVKEFWKKFTPKAQNK